MRPLAFLLAGIVAELRDGLVHVRRTPGLPILLTTASVFLCGNAMLTALLVPYVGTVLHADAHLMGLLLSALGVGFLAGAPVSRLTARRSDRAVLAGGLAALAAVSATAFNTHDAIADLALFTLFGPPAVCVLVTVDTRLTRATPDWLLGRVAAVYATVGAFATLVGMSVGGGLAQVTGIEIASNIGCGMVVLAAVVVAGGGRSLRVAPATVPSRDVARHLEA